MTLARMRTRSLAWHTVVLPLRPAEFDRHILALDIAGFLQALTKRGHHGGVVPVRRSAVEEPDHCHRWPLRGRCERPSRSRAECGYELSSCNGGGHLPAPVLKPKANDTMIGVVVSSGSYNSMHGRMSARGHQPAHLRPRWAGGMSAMTARVSGFCAVQQLEVSAMSGPRLQCSNFRLLRLLDELVRA